MFMEFDTQNTHIESFLALYYTVLVSTLDNLW